MSLKMFVGSSVEGLDVAYAVQQNLEHRTEVTVWDQGIFNLSKSALESLVNALDRFDFGIFIFTPEDVVKMRGSENLAVRDNVLFELGLFIGRLGKDRSFILMPQGQKDFHLPTDLIGMSPGTYRANRSDRNLRAATGGTCQEIYQTMITLGPISPSPQLADSRESKIVPKPLDQLSSDEGTESQSDNVTNDKADWITAYYSGNYDEAIHLIEKLIEQGDQNDENKLFLLSMIGRSKSKIEFTSGLDYLKKLKDDNPELPGFYVTIAEIYSEHGFFDDAFEMLEEGLTSTKRKIWLGETKAKLLNAQGKVDEALCVLNRLITDSPAEESLYIKAAEILNERGRKDEALKMYEAGLKVLPNSENMLYKYGLLLMDTPADKGATLAVFKQLVELNSRNEMYFGYLGNAYLNLGLTGLAIEAYEKANDLAGGKQDWIIGNIGNLFNNQGLYPLAIANLKSALTINPDSAYSHERLAAALKKDLEERKKASDIIRNYKEQAAQKVAELPEKVAELPEKVAELPEPNVGD
jgi:tetratricopeptide (TPR) repeat protein